MNIIFLVNDKLLEFPPDANQDYCLFKLSEAVFPELFNTTEPEIQVRAQMNNHKLAVFLEKSPVAVNNGNISMKEYVRNKLDMLIISMYRTREVEIEQRGKYMNKIDEIKEALDFVDYPDYEFRSFCGELVGMVEEQAQEIFRLKQVVENIDMEAHSRMEEALVEIREVTPYKVYIDIVDKALRDFE